MKLPSSFTKEVKYLPLQGYVVRLKPSEKIAKAQYGVQMSDDKKKTGFALNSEGINRRGRPLGSKNKVPSDPALKELLKKNAPEAVQTLLALMRTGSEGNKLKAAVKIVDMSYTVMLNDEKLNDSPQKEQSEVSSEKEETGVVIHLTKQ